MPKILTSTAADGSMKSSDGFYASALPARTAFLTKHGLRTDDTLLVHLVYEGDNYTRYIAATDELRGDGITRTPGFIADGVATNQKGLALFLPLADCIGVVLHDPVKDTLMLTHLGRHNLEQQGGTKSVEYIVEQFGCNPQDITAWLSPAAGHENYPLFSFQNRSMHDVATEQLLLAGIESGNISRSPIDVSKDKRYFSHSEFLKGNRETDGRFAVVAVLE